MDLSISKDKFEGGLMGVFLGDALGAPHEFRSSKDKYTGKLEYPPAIPSKWHGIRHGVVGQITDDSEMMLALVYSLTPENPEDPVVYDNEKAALEYMEWANSKPMGMGYNTRALFCGVKTVNGFRKRQLKVFPKVSQSNGSLMRCYPLALVAEEDWYSDVNLTNPTRVNRDASKVFLTLVRDMWEGKSKAEALKNQLNDRGLYPPIYAALYHASNKEGCDPNVKKEDDWPCQVYEVNGKCKGWVVVSLYTAIWGWYHNNTLEECIDAIIQRGGDTDTNAAIGGALMGATLGRKKIVSEKRSKENWDILCQADPSEGNFSRPSKYLWRDIEEISTDLRVIN